ncbi:Uncharacterized protein RNJ44_04470 [Nakaseomyces bracarensis]|uniref:Asparagine synthase (glutamine-hydrolyzing) n=1 Tax=Nakaseomyces bracarensis TaxID=273131 RepID=A0ABR4NUZ6_9SACH
MCGILLCSGGFASKSESVLREYYEAEPMCSFHDDRSIEVMAELVRQRGPNYCSWRSVEGYDTVWFSSVLSLRQPFTGQSIRIGEDYILQFNGELYNSEIIDNDTQYIVDLFKGNAYNVAETIRVLDGEFAFTLYDLKKDIVYFGRDVVGKRSLSYSIDRESGELVVTSISGNNPGNRCFFDCVAGVIYVYDKSTKSLDATNIILKPFEITTGTDMEMHNSEFLTKELYSKLSTAVEKRVNTIHPLHMENSPISVLFSGGLDCSVIVALICECLIKRDLGRVTLELLNVAFENKRTKMQPSEAPDRQLAIKSAQDLQDKYPSIDIKLVEVDVSYDEYLKHRPLVIDLMYPKNTEMDLSIAIAFYFASRGHGYIREQQTNKRLQYKRLGLVLFSGLGADELYGGYYKFNNKTEVELANELSVQINNIYRRNLNRDDKVIASNGVEVRYPFLDEDVITYSTKYIPINYKRDKFILRNLASTILNLQNISIEKKRAIQFGAKSAKMTKDGNKSGTDLLK